ncbi:hypothetical protein [Myxococcus phage Mx1]|nr:hypothetical protein [Myxococcus phage Mx1]
MSIKKQLLKELKKAAKPTKKNPDGRGMTANELFDKIVLNSNTYPNHAGLRSRLSELYYEEQVRKAGQALDELTGRYATVYKYIGE